MENENKAYEKVADLLRSMNIDEVCGRCGGKRTKDGISIEYFNKTYEIILPDVTFKPSSVSYVSQLIILHYLTSTGNEKTTGEFVGFRDLPGGMFYYKTYCKQGPERIVKEFGDKPENIFSVAMQLGGEKANFGDASVRVKVFPLVEILIVLYQADNEFPHEAFVLFKNNIINYLSLKDVSMLVGEIATKLNRINKSSGEKEVDLAKTDSNFKYEIASRPGAEFFKRCFSCGTCTASCPVSEIDENFNPRLFIRKSLLGMRKEVLSSKELWFCVQCYTCYARCPQDVRFTDVMTVLRKMSIEEGYAPEGMLEKAAIIGDISQKFRHQLTDYVWNAMFNKKDPEILNKLMKQIEKGIKEFE